MLDTLESIFGSVDPVKFRDNNTGVTFEVEGSEVSFDKLHALSTAFGTKLINFGAETRHGGYCDTCAYEYGVVVIRVDGIDPKVVNGKPSPQDSNEE